MNREDLIQKVLDDFATIRRRAATSYNPDSELEKPLPSAQAQVLFLIASSDGMSIKDLASTIYCTGSAATQQVDILTKLGYVTRDIDPNDRRVTRVHITKLGKQKFSEYKKLAVKYAGSMMGSFSDTELEQFARFLGKIIETIPNKFKKENKNVR